MNGSEVEEKEEDGKLHSRWWLRDNSNLAGEVVVVAADVIQLSNNNEVVVVVEVKVVVEVDCE